MRLQGLNFVAGMPRSGSTLLMNLLAQNSRFHVTGTNDLAELFSRTQRDWAAMDGFKAQGLASIAPRMRNTLLGMLSGFYSEEFTSGKYIFDKSRGWPGLIEQLENVLERKVSIVCTVRDIRDVCASFEKLLRRHPLTVEAVGLSTLEDRLARWLAPDGVIGAPVRRMLDAIDRGLGNRLVIVPYRALTHSPETSVVKLCTELNIPPFLCNPQSVEQVTREDDLGVWRMDLHTVRQTVEPDSGGAWHGILSDRVADRLNKDYADVQYLAGLSGVSRLS